MAGSTNKKTTKKSSASSGRKKTTTAAKRKSTSSASRRTSASKSAAKAAKASPETIDYALYTEIFLWVIIAISLFCFISMLGYGGGLGSAAAEFIGGSFGIMGYVFPFALFFLAAFLISNSHSDLAKIKALGAVLLFVTLCAMMHLLLIGYSRQYTLDQYYEAGKNYHTGGGVVGGALVSFFGSGIGTVGSWLVLFILMIISMILITQRSLIHLVKRTSRRIARDARRSREAHLQQKEAYRQELEKEQMRAQLEEVYPDTSLADSRVPKSAKSSRPLADPRRKQTVSGVSRDTIIPGERKHTIAKPVTYFPELDLFDKETEEGNEAPVSMQTEPAAMKRIRGEVKEAKEKRETKIPKEPLPKLSDDLFKNAFHKGKQLQEEAEKKDLIGEEAISSEKAAAPVKEAVSENAPQEPAAGKAPRKVHSSAAEIQDGIDNVNAAIEETEALPKPEYVFPDISLLKKPAKGAGGTTESELRETAAKLQQVFQTFGVNVRITDVTCGPSVTRYELTPEMGVKVSKIVNLQDDIKLNLAAQDIRIEAPIPGKAAVGIEVPNKKSTGVLLRELLQSEEFKSHPSNLAYAVGKDIAGNIIVSDIAKMPHLLIAGATGSGKSVFINTLIMSILYKAKPEDVKLIMIDPKVVELSVYNGIPHLLIPVVTDPKKAAGALSWAVAEMMKRYQMFAESGVRDLKGYNKRIEQIGDVGDEKKPEKLPQIIVIVDELADLMMVASADVEDAICRLAQLARAAGIHLVIATQRPSVDVITGLIKANMPSRIAFSVSSGVDSRTVLDQVGAEKLLGNGDMLFSPQTYKQPLRVQGAFVSDGEVAAVSEFLKNANHSEAYDKEMEKMQESVTKAAVSSMGGGDGDTDELFAQAGQFIIEKDKASIGMLQRWFKIGFNRAARIMDQLSDAGVVGPEEGTKPRKVLMSSEQFENYLEQN